MGRALGFLVARSLSINFHLRLSFFFCKMECLLCRVVVLMLFVITLCAV